MIANSLSFINTKRSKKGENILRPVLKNDLRKQFKVRFQQVWMGFIVFRTIVRTVATNEKSFSVLNRFRMVAHH